MHLWADCERRTTNSAVTVTVYYPVLSLDCKHYMHSAYCVVRTVICSQLLLLLLTMLVLVLVIDEMLSRCRSVSVVVEGLRWRQMTGRDVQGSAAMS